MTGAGWKACPTPGGWSGPVKPGTQNAARNAERRTQNEEFINLFVLNSALCVLRSSRQLLPVPLRRVDRQRQPSIASDKHRILHVAHLPSAHALQFFFSSRRRHT